MKKLICAVTVLAVSTAQAGVVIHVNAGNCPGPGDGSVGDPYCSIQTAIDNAVDTDEIVVAPGTYFENINFLGKAIWLHSSDGPQVTIIDAQQIGSVVICDSGEGSDTVLEGFTLTGGTGTLFEIVPGFILDVGGGMFNLDSSPTVTSCILTANHAEIGGGMQNWASSPNLTNCTFNGNTVGITGGGLYNASNSSPLVTNCTFSGNASGMRNSIDSCPTVTDCMFSGNTSSGMLNNADSCPAVTNCTFSGNSTDGFGGGMLNFNRGSPLVTDCTFIGNTAVAGGGMYNGDSYPLVTNCTFSDNTAEFAGGGMYNAPGSPTVTNCTFVGNTAFSGGGMWNRGSPMVTNCTFSGNSADDDGGGIFNQINSNSTVTNCTFCGNSPEHIAGDPVVLIGQIQMSTFCPIPVCPGDINGDGNVGINDFLDLLAAWGPCP